MLLFEFTMRITPLFMRSADQHINQSCKQLLTNFLLIIPFARTCIKALYMHHNNCLVFNKKIMDILLDKRINYGHVTRIHVDAGIFVYVLKRLKQLPSRSRLTCLSNMFAVNSKQLIKAVPHQHELTCLLITVIPLKLKLHLDTTVNQPNNCQQCR